MERMLKYYFFVAEVNEDVVGFVDMERIDDDTAMLTGLAVREDWRGRGIGKTLAKFAVHFLRAMGFKRIKILTLSTNAPALHIYESMGFRKIGQQGDVVTLEKEL